MKCSLTILFEDPFWIGLYERFGEDKYEVCKITFGAEPKDYEIYDFLRKRKSPCAAVLVVSIQILLP